MTIDNLHAPIAVDDLQQDDLVKTGEFIVGPLATGSLYPVHHTAVPGFELLTPEANHARKAADLLNFAAHQMTSLANWDKPEPVKPAPLSAIQRAAAIGVELHFKRKEVAQIEATAGDASAGKSAQQGLSGSAEGLRHDALVGEIDALQRELVSLEVA